jgi:hypothetical protein
MHLRRYKERFDSLDDHRLALKKAYADDNRTVPDRNTYDYMRNRQSQLSQDITQFLQGGQGRAVVWLMSRKHHTKIAKIIGVAPSNVAGKDVVMEVFWDRDDDRGWATSLKKNTWVVRKPFRMVGMGLLNVNHLIVPREESAADWREAERRLYIKKDRVNY